MRTIAIIPARSGSKGLRDKNILPLMGKPMLAYTIEAAREAAVFDEIYLSTDSAVYADIGKAWGANIPFLRRPELAGDAVGSWDVVLDVLARYEAAGCSYDVAALLQPTSPLRSAEDIRAAFRVMAEHKADAVVSVCEAAHSPLWCNVLPADGCMDGFIQHGGLMRRQVLSKYYRLNGAVYISGCYAYVMPRERSVDIGEKMDFLVAEAIMKINNIDIGCGVNKQQTLLLWRVFSGSGRCAA